jgi:hypothetical protein
VLCTLGQVSKHAISLWFFVTKRMPSDPCRGTEKLIGSLGRDVVDYLNKFRALDSLVDIAAWKKFCEEHPSKDLQSE